jgi:hypothetical protein
MSKDLKFKIMLLKKLFAIIVFTGCVSLTNMALAQTVSLANGCVVNELVNVNGVITGEKGIPITGYTVDIVQNGVKIRIATNVPFSGGKFTFTGKTPDCANIVFPCPIEVTTNRQKSATIKAVKCVISN